MLIPVEPFLPSPIIINENIIYRDTILNLKEVGNNIEVISISNVKESSLGDCLKSVFRSNKDIVFHTIQYSKKDNKVYFYIDRGITLKGLEGRNIRFYKPITSSMEILEELKNILVVEKNKDNDCVSLYDVLKLLKKAYYPYRIKKMSLNRRLEYLIKKNYGAYNIIVEGFEPYTNELEIKFIHKKCYKFKFTKKDEDLFITQSEINIGNDMLVILKDTLSDLYDLLEQYRNFEKQYNYGFKSINSNFLINVDQYGIRIYSRSQSNPFGRDFELKANCYNNEYEYDCNSKVLINAIRGKETEVLKSVFVRIEDCPEWSQSMLYEIRQNQLAEAQKIEDELKYKEMRKQKRLELRNKLFPFLNNK